MESNAHEFDDSSSESDDQLEEVGFLANTPKKSFPDSFVKSQESDDHKTEEDEGGKSIGGKLDKLLTSYKEETLKDEIHQKLKTDLLNYIEEGSQNDASIVCDEEMEEHIGELEVKIDPDVVELPRLTVFDPDKVNCLFDEQVHPAYFGLDTTQLTQWDAILVGYKPDELVPLLVSNSLSMYVRQLSCPKVTVTWLLSLLSTHSCPLTVDLCTHNLEAMLENLADSFTVGDEENWLPTPLDIARIFVNMGANPDYLLANQTIYSPDNIQKHLTAKQELLSEQKSRKVNIENCRRLFEVFTMCFDLRPAYSKEEISLVIGFIMRIAIDWHFHNSNLLPNVKWMLSTLLECYQSSDWPSVVYTLCNELSQIPSDHPVCVYLLQLLPVTERGNLLQSRLAFVWLCMTLEPTCDVSALIPQLNNVTPLTISNLGHCPHDPVVCCHLYTGLHRLMKGDVGKLDCALTLLDRAVGDQTSRSAQPKEDMHFLTEQVKLLIKDIRDSIKMLELLMVKDKMSIMTAKWRMTSHSNTQSTQRSLFSWVKCSSSQPVVEKLQDSVAKPEDGPVVGEIEAPALDD